MIKRLKENPILSSPHEKRLIFLIVFINLLIKLVPAAILELGNDEVYYWTYALFPDWSHFDHPPMVGLTIQLFTLNLTFVSSFALRLGSLVLSSINIIILYTLVKKLFSQRAAVISTLLFTSSFYFNIISGLFILPDTPQVFFILLALLYGIPSLINETPDRRDESNLLLFGFFTGLAFLSKYHSLFLWFGFGLFIVFHNRKWLKKPSLYLSFIITLILMIPVLYWNLKNDFISFTFQGSRVSLLDSSFNIKSFLQFIFGQVLYQNPVVSAVFIFALTAAFKSNRNDKKNLVLIYLAAPLIIVFTFFSLFRSALPHWSGPAFISLIILAGKWLSDLYEKKRSTVVKILLTSNGIFLIVLITGTVQILTGSVLPADKNTDPTKIGKNDFTMDMYGWNQAKEKFIKFLSKENITDFTKVKIISNKWFPAAHLDFYIAHPLKIDLMVDGKVEAAHKYFWINKKRSIGKGDKIYYITTSQQFFPPAGLSSPYNKIVARDTLPIIRNGIVVKNLFIYEMR